MIRCTFSAQCSEEFGKFQCTTDRLCIPSWQRCDDHFDCEDRSDEFDCPPNPPGTNINNTISVFITSLRKNYSKRGIAECPEGYWQCPSSRACIPESERCESPILLRGANYYDSDHFHDVYEPQYCNCPSVYAGDVTMCEDELHCGSLHCTSLVIIAMSLTHSVSCCFRLRGSGRLHVRQRRVLLVERSL